MKTFIFSALALGMLASCANTDVEGVVENGEPVAITLNTGVEATVVANTRAVLSDGIFNARIFGWEASAKPDYATVDTTWSVVSSNINVTSETSLTLNKYYNLSKDVSTYMKACYPNEGTFKDGIFTFTSPVEDGSLDVLYADEVSGNRSQAAGVLTFKHLLTQLKFNVKAGVGMPTNTQIVSISLNSAAVPTGINLSEVGGALTTKAVTDLNVLNIDTKVIPDAGVAVGDPLMIAPISGNTIVLTVVTTDGTNQSTYNNVQVTVGGDDTGFIAGKAYEITITFKEKISVSASVTKWDTTGVAGGEVEL